MPTTTQRLRVALLCGLAASAAGFTFGNGSGWVRLAAAALVAVTYLILLRTSRKAPRPVAAVSLLLASPSLFPSNRDFAFIVVFLLSVAEALLAVSVLLAPRTRENVDIE